jgi:aminoglycoside phosphotransferase (APT) family kinase protein
MAVTTTEGLRRIAQGREAEIFAWGEGTVLKLYRGDEFRISREREFAATAAARGAGGPVPSALELVEVDRRPGMVMERVEGIDMLTQVGKKPWTIFRCGRQMAEAQAALHRISGPAELPELREKLARQMRGSDAVPADMRDRALAALESLPEGAALCHGDFHPGNAILTGAGAVVIDWPGATRGTPAADHARTLLTLKFGQVPEGVPLVVRYLNSVGRWVLLRGYVSAYRRATGVGEDEVMRWMLPVAAHRLTEGIEGEREPLLRYIAGMRSG